MADVKENKNPQGFYFNQQACIGCRTCQVACKDKNDLEVGYLFRRVESFEVGEFPKPATFHYSGACNHCHTPACVEVCPAGATYINEEDGTVQHDDEACIGCGYCALSCPYRAPKVDRDAGRSVKCDGCTRRVAEGGAPVCVEACPLRALDFGPIDELREKYGAVADVPPLPDATATSPNLVLTPPAPAQADPDRVRAEGRVLNIREIV